jgi:hypothetical protein
MMSSGDPSLDPVIGAAQWWFRKGWSMQDVYDKLRNRKAFRGLSDAEIRLAVGEGLRNWAATYVANQPGFTGTLEAAFGFALTSGERVGIRVAMVMVDPNGLKQNVSVIVNASAGEPITNVVARAVAMGNAGQLRSKSNKAYPGVVSMAPGEAPSVLALVRGGLDDPAIDML